MSKVKIKQKSRKNCSQNTLQIDNVALSDEIENITEHVETIAIQENIDETMLKENKENTVPKVNSENTVAENTIVDTVPENNMNKEVIQSNVKEVKSQNDIKQEELKDIVQQYDIQEALAKNNVENELSKDNINNIMPQIDIENVVSHNIIEVPVLKNNLLDMKPHNVETIAPQNDNAMLEEIQEFLKEQDNDDIIENTLRVKDMLELQDKEPKENAERDAIECNKLYNTMPVDEVGDDNDGILLNNAENKTPSINNIVPTEIVEEEKWVFGARQKLLRHSVEWNDIDKVLTLLDENINYLHGVDQWNRNPLYLAVVHQRPLLAKILIEKGADINNKDNITEMTPLHVAVKNGDVESTRLLLTQGANFDEVNKYHVTPLHLAVESANEDIVKLLLEYGANVHVIRHGKSLIILAVESGYIGLAKLLHDNGCDINFITDAGQTALHLATESQNIRLIKMLLDLGARCNIRTSKGSALDIAAQKGNCSVVRLLLSGLTDVEDRLRIGIPALNLAFQHGKQNVVHTLLMCGIDPKWQIPGEKCFLHMAIELEWAYTISMLLDKGVDANSITYDNITALHIAVEVANTDVIKMLIKKGADVNKKTSTGLTALYIAVENACRDIVKMLLEAGADPDVTDNSGTTPLHVAFDVKRPDIVKILLDHKANPNIRKFRKSPLELAINCKWFDVIHRLLTKGADVNALTASNLSLLIEAIKRGNIEMMRTFLEFGADMEFKEMKSGMTPLQFAIACSNIDAVTFLLDRGADLNYATPSGVTGLQIAFNKRDEDMVRLLLEREAQISRIFGKSPLQVAVELKWLNITRMLLERGCDPNECINTFEGVLREAMRRADSYMDQRLSAPGAREKFQSRGYSLLHIAAETGMVEMADLLLDNGANVNCQDFDDATPIHIALKKRHDQFALKLIERGADVRLVEDRQRKTTLHIAVEGDCYESVKAIIKKKVVKIDMQDRRQVTALYIAAAKNNNFLTEILLKHGAKVNICNKTDNCTVLHYALHNKNQKMVKMFLRVGIAVHCGCPPINTAMGLALHTLKEDWMVHLLLAQDLEDREKMGRKAVERFMPHISRLSNDSPYMGWLLLHLARKNGQLQEYDYQTYNIPSYLRQLHESFCYEVRQMIRDEELQHAPYYGILTSDPMIMRTLQQSDKFIAAIEQVDYKKRYPLFGSVLQESIGRIKKAAEMACEEKKRYVEPPRPRWCITS